MLAIEIELSQNQKSISFIFGLHSIKEIEATGRFDTNFYRKYFKQQVFSIQNYTRGCKSFQDFGFKLIRGNNLAVSIIGTSIYSDSDRSNFYKLILPKNIDKYDNVEKTEYLGDPRL